MEKPQTQMGLEPSPGGIPAASHTQRNAGSRMSTITVRRHDVTTEEVTDALRAGLDPRYDVAPGMRMPRVPLFGTPRPDRAELILVSSSALARAQVKIIRHSGQTDIRVTPGGLIINTIGLAAKVRSVLRDASDLTSSGR
jgi:hypothetical protein